MGGLLDDDVRRWDEFADADDVLDRALGGADVDLVVHDGVVGGQALDDALNLPYVRFDGVRDVVDDVVRQYHAELGRLVADDRHARLHIRRLNVRHEAALKARAQTVFELDHLHRGTVGGDDDLFAGLVEVVEGVEKFLLHADLAGNELDIVHEQQVDVAVFVAEFLLRVVLDGLDHLICEVVAFDVGDHGVRFRLVDALPDREQQMRFAEPGVAVNEEGVIDLARLVRDGNGRGVGEFVGVADNELVEGVARDLGQAVVLFGGILVVVKLVLREDQQIEGTGEEVCERRCDRRGIALGDDVALEVRRRVEDETGI